MSNNNLKILNKNISIRDRSKDLILLKISNKHPIGSIITFNPKKKLDVNMIDLFKLNQNSWRKLINIVKFDWYNTSKKSSAIVCGHVVENGVAKYLVNKSVKNIFTVNQKQLLESKK